MQVEDGKPSDQLVRYLSKDVEILNLEYHTDLLTYYILNNITHTLLLKKANFIEQNKAMLGLISFEFVSLHPFEAIQRDFPSWAMRKAIKDAGYEESWENEDLSLPQVATGQQL